jgi:hypothetical protein
MQQQAEQWQSEGPVLSQGRLEVWVSGCGCALLQDYLAGGTKGGLWRPQRMPQENVAFYQWGYNQARAFCMPSALHPKHTLPFPCECGASLLSANPSSSPHFKGFPCAAVLRTCMR